MSAAPAYSGLTNFVPLLVIFAIFYFLLIRPQQRRLREEQKMRDSLSKGDQVVTSGGIHGTVVGFKANGDVVELRIAENVKILVNKSAIAGRRKPAEDGDEHNTGEHQHESVSSGVN